MKKTLRVGLIGGIGSGKSTACNIFAELGVPIIDADVIVHKFSVPGQTGFIQIKNQFGEQFITEAGDLDRKKLRNKIFSSKAARKKLENILHPMVYQEIERLLKEMTEETYCIICLPLLLEIGASAIVDRILVVDIPEKLQISRAALRDKTEANNIKTIMATQIPRKARIAAADELIKNDKDLNFLRQQIKALHRFYTTSLSKY